MEPARATDWAEWAMDLAAAAALATSVAVASSASALAAEASLAGGAGAFLAALAALRRVPVEPPAFALPDFALGAIEPACASAAEAPAVGSETELLLEDRLTNVEPGSRVVRLFDVSPGRATAGGNPDSAPDASRALSEALAELRRSLR